MSAVDGEEVMAGAANARQRYAVSRESLRQVRSSARLRPFRRATTRWIVLQSVDDSAGDDGERGLLYVQRGARRRAHMPHGLFMI